MIPTLWSRWLHAAILGVMLFGMSMVLTPGLIKRFFSALIYSSPSAIEAELGATANAYIALMHGVIGAVTFGWGTAMLLALRGPFLRCEREGWILIAVPLVAWYIPDTLFSVYTGFWQNAAFNTFFATLFAVPLIASRKHFDFHRGNP